MRPWTVGLAFVLGCGGGTTTSPAAVGNRPGRACASHPLEPGAPDFGGEVRCEPECTLWVGEAAVPLPTVDGAEVVGAATLQLDGDAASELAVWLDETVALGPDGDMFHVTGRLIVLDGAIEVARLSWGMQAPEPQSESCTARGEVFDDDCDGDVDAIAVTETCQAELCADGGADADHAREYCGEDPRPTERVTRLVRGADGRFQ